jgi:CheY-like chemotaxis protein
MVLLVDPTSSTLESTALLLEHLGFQVTSFQNPQDALIALRMRPQRYDLVLCDDQSLGQSGLSLSAAIRQHRADLPIVFLSDRKDESVQHSVSKPVEPVALVEVLQRVLAQRSPTSG